MFDQTGETKNLGSMNLGSYAGVEVKQLFNNNLECLFNHMQVVNSLMFFSFKKEDDTCTVNLNSFDMLQSNTFDEDSVDVINDFECPS